MALSAHNRFTALTIISADSVYLDRDRTESVHRWASVSLFPLILTCFTRKEVYNSALVKFRASSTVVGGDIDRDDAEVISKFIIKMSFENRAGYKLEKRK